MLTIRQLYRHTIFYTLANTLEALTPLIMIPILTRYLSPHEYGLWAVFQSAVAFLIPIIGNSFRDAVRMRYLNMDSKEFSVYINTTTFMILAFSFITLVLCVLFNQQLTEWFKISIYGLICLVLMAVLYSFFYIALAICQFSDNRKEFGIFQAINSIIAVIASFALVMSGFGWQGCVFGRLAGLIVVCYFSYIFLYRNFGWLHPVRIDKKYIHELLKFYSRYLPYGLFLVVIPFVNRLMIANMDNMSGASFYAVSGSFAAVLYIIVSGFMHAWQPWLFKKLASHEDKDIRSIIISAFIFIFAVPVIGVIITFVSYIFLPILIGNKFADVDSFILPMMLTTAATGYFLLAQSFIHFKQKVGIMSLCSILVVVLNLLISWKMIDEMGAIGAAWGSMAAYLIAAIVTFIFVIVIYRKDKNSSQFLSQTA